MASAGTRKGGSPSAGNTTIAPPVAPVQIGIVDEAQGVAQVLGGLRSGDRVVVGNVGTLGEGMQVQIVGTEVSARSR